jgi:hypothetical protein
MPSTNSTTTSTPFNPYINPNTESPWESAQSDALKNPTFNPSTFRTQMGEDGSFNIYSGDDLVSSFQDQSAATDFISQYSQGWQQRQDTRSSEQSWKDILSQYGWTPPDIESPTVETSQMQEQGGQIIDPESGQVGSTPDVEQTVGQTTQADLPEELQTALMEAVKSASSMDDLLSTLGPIVGSLSEQSQVEAAQAEMARESTVQGQLEDLMASFEGGDPPWATGPMRTANAIMAQRGLSASSMAGRAITNAVMEAALPIAQADANMSAQFQFANLSNLQQARVQNAQSFLQMDLANFNAAQQMQMFKAQERAQALLSDTAQENAARQFNASSENQTNQFMANLSAQVQQFNAQQANGMEQFNAGQSNSLEQFRAQLQSQRDQFNAQNRLIIDQANAKWRQEISTINNATINEANRINAQNLLSVSLAEYNNISQSRRDALNYAYTASESAKDRATELIIAELREEGATKRAERAASSADRQAQQQSRDGLFAAAGKFVASLF